ncbi:uncharacterized protein LOC123557324 [Mercenaria mercenaria]|uniref:uncharacterized protein LOC123557324 n=1 Tax=Mercenaria mercenaria TaxID=6596 RepID=UPI00234F8970|nr:uncharacterized protein LOC123557324 [Mercenaria mercenaria]
MSGIPEHYKVLQTQLCQIPDFDNKLSEVLDEIGVNDEMVQRRRRNELLSETLGTIVTKLRGYDRPEYHFGSRSEGTTTVGLQSDIDRLYCVKDINVVQNRKELQPEDSSNTMNLLMVQDDSIAPGYCHLEVLNEKLQYSSEDVTLKNDHYIRVRDGRIFYKNTVMQDFIPGHGERHGPSWAGTSQTGFTDQDTVAAFHCKTWPYQARDWLNQSSLGGWPTDEMKRKCMNAGCFVVPTGSSPDIEMEWRISTSIAERQLVFSLNITQLRCYILMKMLIKTFMKETQKNKISSFMCKSVLLYCIESSLPDEWQKSNLSQCLIKCLERLKACIREERCPHFIIPKNNLMAGKFSAEVKKNLLEMMQYITGYTRLVLAKAIKIDDLSQRFSKKLGLPIKGEVDDTPLEICCHIKAQFLIDTAVTIRSHQLTYLKHMCMHHKSYKDKENFLQTSLQNLDHQTSRGDEFQQEVHNIFAPFVSSFYGSILASRFGICSDNTRSNEALALLNEGSDSDVSSGRLKLASTFYCSGDMERTESILQITEAKYDLRTVEPICRCTHIMVRSETINMLKFQEVKNEVVKNNVAFCVVFLPCEMKCVPKELQYEMFRSTGQETAGDGEVSWMDWAVVDSLPYLYFLQYKIYKQLHRGDAQQTALLHLVNTAETTPNLGHRETALNLIGQCMEEENRPIDALQYFAKSLNLRRKNNAAKIHICRCLANIIQNNVTTTTTLYEREPAYN